MKKSIVAAISVFTLMNISAYEGSSFSEVWDQILSDKYQTLPQNELSLSAIGGWAAGKLKQAANRTVTDRSDLLPRFDKLAHPNGVCLAGVWNITKENPYSGYFKKGSRGLIISRASTALSETKQGDRRAFGLAGKIFPTIYEGEKVETANFFTVDDLGGTKADHFTGVGLTNAPPTSASAGLLLKYGAYVLQLARVFGAADSNPNERQLYPISELGETERSNIITPKWMKLQAVEGQTVDREDFRDELNIENYPNGLVFKISVASEEIEGQKQWNDIGSITYADSSASDSCDHRLHFFHAKWRTDLKHQ